MARSVRATKGPGFTGMIIFIVLSVALIVGYAFLIPAYSKLADSLDRLHADIKKGLEDAVPALKGKAKAVASRSDVAYDSSFFTEAAKLANQGLQYQALLDKLGYGGDPISQIDTILGQAGQKADNLQQFIQNTETEKANLKARLDQANTELATRKAQAEAADKRAIEESRRLKDARQAAMDSLKQARAEFQKTIDEIKALMNRAVEDQQKAWAQNTEQSDKFKKDMAELQDKLHRLDQQVLTLQEQLAKEKPKPPEITEGHITHADLMKDLAFIDLGKPEGIKVGDVFDVIRIGRGGERIPKAELAVTIVNDLGSQCDITKQNLDDPILRNDLVVRRMRPEEK